MLLLSLSIVEILFTKLLFSTIWAESGCGYPDVFEGTMQEWKLSTFMPVSPFRTTDRKSVV